MRSFSCPSCHQLVFFENSECLSCGTPLAFDPDRLDLVALPDTGPGRCANDVLAACNWLASDAAPGSLCRSCQLTRTRPNDIDLANDAEVAAGFVDTEAAKRRLVFQLLEVDLPVVSYLKQPDGGLAFDLLSSRGGPVTTGHADGVITVDLAESDDAHREQLRHQLGEAYRTVLGHLRHEIGHYYWQTLVEPDTSFLAGSRRLFGDDRADYAQALSEHYATGARPGWDSNFVSAYASAHPWEDFAETFAHYLHIRDTLQTAASFGMVVTGPAGAALDPTLIAAPDLEPDGRFEEILSDWLPLTYALNAINRSMGKDDLYPFVLTAPAIDKLEFVHDCVRAQKERSAAGRVGTLGAR